MMTVAASLSYYCCPPAVASSTSRDSASRFIGQYLSGARAEESEPARSLAAHNGFMWSRLLLTLLLFSEGSPTIPLISLQLKMEGRREGETITRDKQDDWPLGWASTPFSSA